MNNYPLEVASIVRDKTFYVQSRLQSALEDKDTPPLMLYGKFSRYEFCLINEEKAPATANLRMSDMREILRKSHELSAHETLETVVPVAERATDMSSDAYNVKIYGGKIGGKTPAEFLKEHPDDGIQFLKEQGAFLKTRLEGKYGPANKKQMLAIADAIKLHQAGKMNLDNVSSSADIMLYDGGMRPLTNRKVKPGVQPGCSFVYELKIIWKQGAKNPVTIQIENYYAPVEKRPDGRLNVIKSKLDRNNYTKNFMNLSKHEWMDDVVAMIDDNLMMFKIINAKALLNASAEADRKQRQSSYNRPEPQLSDFQQSYQQPPVSVSPYGAPPVQTTPPEQMMPEPPAPEEYDFTGIPEFY